MNSAPHIDPAAGMFEALARRMAEIHREHLGEALCGGSSSSNLSGNESDSEGARLIIHPDRFYSTKVLADRWFGGRLQGVYEIPPIDLPRKKVGARRGKTLFYGLDVMLYEGTITKQQYDAFQKAKLKVLEGSAKAPAIVRRLGNA